MVYVSAALGLCIVISIIFIVKFRKVKRIVAALEKERDRDYNDRKEIYEDKEKGEAELKELTREIANIYIMLGAIAAKYKLYEYEGRKDLLRIIEDDHKLDIAFFRTKELHRSLANASLTKHVDHYELEVYHLLKPDDDLACALLLYIFHEAQDLSVWLSTNLDRTNLDTYIRNATVKVEERNNSTILSLDFKKLIN